jgi:predicted ArsR family transcriptional regulator
MGLTPDQARRGVHALERAGLLEVRRGGRGRCAEVTIVAVQEPTECSAGTGELS